ncbi:UPF0182 family protein [Alicyclobacillus sp.]|uniref:UPF0182 family protein n=1 Tax=Alicyclobacillus sp. TaxID=61169 RepID=UPI0025C0C78B|nr:UPF0182 family protein [Alicyclobacillus sp.]MCL6517231.1 UPF0182 family protein [Alicyclobacillus sp.]
MNIRRTKRLVPRRTPRGLGVLAGIVLVLLIGHVWFHRLYDLRLHVALGYGDVYSKNMVFELCTRWGGAVLYALIGAWAVRPFAEHLPRWAFALVRWPAILAGFVLGYALWYLNATDWMLFFAHRPFGRVDPIFHLDLSFFVYQLPLLAGLAGRLAGTLLLLSAVRLVALVMSMGLQRLTISRVDLPRLIRREARVVLCLIGGALACFTALSWLGRYLSALTEGNGSFLFGPGFVGARLSIPVFSVLHTLLLALVAVTVLHLAVRVDRVLQLRDGMVVLRWRGLRPVGLTFAGYVGSLVVTGIVGGLVNALYVHPNQNAVEMPYIQRTIDMTRWAIGIDQGDQRPFTPAPSLTADAIQRDKPTLDNARINDQGQTTDIYNQLQSFKSYFHFDQVSVDRYGGQEVYVGARQMNVDKVPVQTWINRTLVYTHGYGLAASPVNQVNEDGLPAMLAKDTPQQTQAPLPAITRPEIYFGRMGTDVIAPSREPEFDYPTGSADHTSHYQGGYGLPVEGNRWMLAIAQRSLRFYTSDQITPQSLYLFDRDIYRRVQDIAPFLRYDQDAYPFIDDKGHIEWMLDAYTATDRIPYAQAFLGAAYIRNSVKVTIDAYTGKVTYYVINPSDPMIQSLMRLYPTLFTTQVPPDVAAHFRYPQDLFQAQAEALTRYHMTDAASFYNQEDLWAPAAQIYHQNEKQVRPPVYQMVRMPGETSPHFVLSIYFTPTGKDNLNGWFVADNEPGRYGHLTVYQFPQSTLVFGPMQAENQIDADPSISSQLSLWNQQGSHVVRGDLLLLPIGDTVLYVEPVYLVANRQGSLPQLARVIVNYNKQVFMDTSLGAALQDLLRAQGGDQPAPNTPGAAAGGGAGGPSGTGAGEGAGAAGAAPGAVGAGDATGAGAPAGSTAKLAQQANQLLRQYEVDTAKGDFEAAGRDLKQLESVLARLAGQAR